MDNAEHLVRIVLRRAITGPADPELLVQRLSGPLSRALLRMYKDGLEDYRDSDSETELSALERALAEFDRTP